MKFNEILSTDLPEIDKVIKECINFGQWLLYRSSPSEGGLSSDHYLLRAGEEVFELTSSGEVLSKVGESAGDLGIEEIFYFSDMPRPPSQSNRFLQSVVGH